MYGRSLDDRSVVKSDRESSSAGVVRSAKPRNLMPEHLNPIEDGNLALSRQAQGRTAQRDMSFNDCPDSPGDSW